MTTCSTAWWSALVETTASSYAITAVENEVEVELLWPGVPEWSSYPPLPYQREIDRVREWIADYRRDEARKRVLARRAQDEPDPW